MNAMNGKKTWIAMILTSVGILVTEVGVAVNNGNVTPDGAFKIVGAVMGIIGPAHKLIKGE